MRLWLDKRNSGSTSNLTCDRYTTAPNAESALRQIFDRELAAKRIAPLVHRYSKTGSGVSEVHRRDAQGDQRLGRSERRAEARAPEQVVSPKTDTLNTGEAQPRLPEAGRRPQHPIARFVAENAFSPWRTSTKSAGLFAPASGRFSSCCWSITLSSIAPIPVSGETGILSPRTQRIGRGRLAQASAAALLVSLGHEVLRCALFTRVFQSEKGSDSQCPWRACIV
jgi:hypothetical protein